MTLHYVIMAHKPTAKIMEKGTTMDGVDEEFRTRLRGVLDRSGRSMRGLSAALGRDPGYLQSLLDPTRPSRARPTPADLLRASDATGISFVELLETLWAIDPLRLAEELGELGIRGVRDPRVDALGAADRRAIADFIEFVIARRAGRESARRRPPDSSTTDTR